MKTRTRRCVICGRIYYGFGQLAVPVSAGRCCDECHAEHVAPERMRQAQAQAEQGED